MRKRLFVSKHLTAGFLIAIVTFIIGMVASAIWLNRHNWRPVNDTYFPIGVFRSHGKNLKWTSKFYSGCLSAMQEPALVPKDKNIEAYRFLWLRSFNPPVSIRLWRVENQSYICIKRLSGVGIPQNGEVIFPKTLTINETHSITEEEWLHFQELLKRSQFWLMPAEDETQIGLDGSGWLLEGVKSNQYHVVDRQSPEQGDFKETCMYLLRISGMETGSAAKNF